MPRLLLILLFILLLHLGRAAAPTAPAAPGPGNSTEAPRATAGNGTRPSPSPETRRPPGPGLLSGSGLPVLRRAVYVLSALSALAALYFVLRAVRLKKPQKKYGLLSSHDENIELGSLDSDEDTVFETRNLRRTDELQRAHQMEMDLQGYLDAEQKDGQRDVLELLLPMDLMGTLELL
ncbi:chromosome 28 C19orf24 [Willisornis vidua]|uniref:Chromosome 28 C19orf24 n=1 Tax=Willisornis vidua TaxID=1566151 RepID=A0ABQ9D3V8_9PASS|nr:chromosome 28 C19orf24 [Willisornis vidua]